MTSPMLQQGREAYLPLRYVIEVWDLSLSDVATIFSVSRQAVAKWVAAGPPAERAPAIADLAAATDWSSGARRVGLRVERGGDAL